MTLVPKTFHISHLRYYNSIEIDLWHLRYGFISETDVANIEKRYNSDFMESSFAQNLEIKPYENEIKPKACHVFPLNGNGLQRSGFNFVKLNATRS